MGSRSMELEAFRDQWFKTNTDKTVRVGKPLNPDRAENVNNIHNPKLGGLRLCCKAEGTGGGAALMKTSVVGCDWILSGLLKY